MTRGVRYCSRSTATTMWREITSRRSREAIKAEALKLSETVKLAEAKKDKMISDFKLREAKLVEAEAVAANAEI